MPPVDTRLAIGWLCDAAYPPRSGIGNYVYQLTSRLAGLSGPLALVHWGRRPPLFQGPLTDVVLPPWTGKRFVRRLAPALSPAVRRLDIMHFPTEFELSYLRPGRAARVVTVHGCAAATLPPHLHHGMSPGLTRRVAAALAKVEGVVTVSESSAVEIEQVYGLSRDRVRVVPNGVGPVFLQARRAPAEWYRRIMGIDGPFVLSVGLMIPKKNQVTALRAFASIAGRFPSLSFVHVGPSGPLEGLLRKEAARLGLGGRLVTIGFQEEADLARLYAGASLLLFPSFHEGFGLPVLEAMAAGCPVIASSIPALREVTGGAAPLFEPEDHQAMAAEATRVLEDPDHRTALVEAGRERAGAYSWDDSARRMLDFYREIAGR